VFDRVVVQNVVANCVRPKEIAIINDTDKDVNAGKRG